MSENLLLTPPEVVQSPVYFTTDESEVGSFFGNHMSSASSGFEGFDISFKDWSLTERQLDELHSEKFEGKFEHFKVTNISTQNTDNIGSKIFESDINPKYVFTSNGNPSKNVAIAENDDSTSGCGQKEVTQVKKIFSKENKDMVREGNVSKNFEVDFGTINDISQCETSLSFSPQYLPKRAPQAVIHTPETNFIYNPKEIVESRISQNKGCNDMSVAKDKLNLTTTEVTKIQTDMGPPAARTDGTVTRQTDITRLETDGYTTTLLTDTLQTEATDVKTMLKLIMGNISTVGVDIKEQKTEVATVNNKMDLQNNKIDNLQTGFVEFKTEIERCKAEVIGLRQEVVETIHQVELMSAQVLSNSTEISKLKQENAQLEGILVEKMLNNSLHMESKIQLIKGEVNHHKVLVSEINEILQNSKIELEVLKSKYSVLEGAVINNRDHSNQLKEQLVGLANHMLNGSSTDPQTVKTLVQHISSQSSGSFTPKQTLTNNCNMGVNGLPSIAASPLVSPEFTVPNSIITQQPQEFNPSPCPYGRMSEEEFILKGIFNKEKIPCFDGSNISAPQFLEESEVYFALVNIMNDRNKLKVIGSFMKGVALQWWRRVAKDITSWEDAKKEILEQYFSDYNRQKFKQEWKEHDFDKVPDIEQFVLQAFHLLDIVKPKYTFKKKCQTVASRLPPLLMTFLLQKDFSSEKEFMNMLKEAITLTKFKCNTHMGTSTNIQSKGTASNNTSQTNGNNNSNQTHGSNTNFNWGNTSQSNGNNANLNWGNNTNQQSGNNTNWGSTNNQGHNIVTNPNYKGKPSNFDPNYKNRNGNYSNNPHYGNNHTNRSHGQNGRSGGRSWYNNNSGRSQRPYYNRGNGGNNHGNQQATPSTSNNGQQNRQDGVNNIAIATPQVSASPPTTPVLTSNVVAAGNVPVNTQDLVYLSAALFNQLLGQNYTPNTSLAGDGLNLQSQNSTN